jgi:hypothetical protein
MDDSIHVNVIKPDGETPQPSLAPPEEASSTPEPSSAPTNLTSSDQKPEKVSSVKVKHAHKFIFGYLALLLLVAAIAGVYSWQHKKVTSLDAQVSSLQKQQAAANKQIASLQTIIKNTKSSSATSISVYAGWNTYTLPKEKLTFRYPTTWAVENNLTDSSNDGVQFTSKTDKSFEILIGAGQDVAAIDNYDGNCVQQADAVTFDKQTAYLDFVGFANTNAVPPSCSPASSTIQSVLLSKSSTLANVSNFFLTKNISQPAAPSASEIVVDIDYNAPNGAGTNNKTLSAIESNTDYKDAKLVVNSMSY